MFRVGTNAAVPSGFGNVARDGYEGNDQPPTRSRAASWSSLVSQDPYSFTFYKLGDTYYAARSNEFGYANYEIIPAPQIAVEPADRAVEPVLDRARADGRAEEADRSDPPAGDQAARRAEEEHHAQRPAEGGGVAQARRLLRREDLAAAQSGPAAEVPGHARGDAAARWSRRWPTRRCRRRNRKRRRGCSPTCTSSAEEAGRRVGAVCRPASGSPCRARDPCWATPTVAAQAAMASTRPAPHSLRAPMKRLLREPLVHFLLLGALLFGVYSFTQPATPRSRRRRRSGCRSTTSPSSTVLYQSQWRRAADAGGARAHGREQGAGGSPLSRGARDGPRQGRHDRQAPHGAEDAVPRRGRRRRARADDGRAQGLVREEQRQVRAAAARSASGISTSRPTGAARARATTPSSALAKLAGQPEDAKSRRRSPTRSCSRTTTAIARPISSPRSSDRRSRLASRSCRPARGRGRSSRASAGISSSSTRSIPGRVPAFEEIEADVKTAWLSEQKATAWEKAYKDMRAKYTVLLPAPPDAQTAARIAATPRRKEIPDLIGRRRRNDDAGGALHSRAPARRHGTHAARVVGARGTSCVPRDQGDGARPVRRALAHAGAVRHAAAGRAADAGRRQKREAARGRGARGFARRAALDRRRAERARRQAHRVRGTAADDHRCAGSGRAAGRQDDSGHRAPVAAVGRDRRIANAVGGDGHVHRRGHPAHPVRRRSPAVRARSAADRAERMDAGEDGHRVHRRAQHHARRRHARLRERRRRCRSTPPSP